MTKQESNNIPKGNGIHLENPNQSKEVAESTNGNKMIIDLISKNQNIPSYGPPKPLIETNTSSNQIKKNKFDVNLNQEYLKDQEVKGNSRTININLKDSYNPGLNLFGVSREIPIKMLIEATGFDFYNNFKFDILGYDQSTDKYAIALTVKDFKLSQNEKRKLKNNLKAMKVNFHHRKTTWEKASFKGFNEKENILVPEEWLDFRRRLKRTP